MKSLKSATRRGGIVSIAALSALTLVGCSAGQVTQTADQVAAVDGNYANHTDPEVSIRDAQILLNDVNGEASLRFVVGNQDLANEEHALESVSVDGQEVQMPATEPIGHNCTLVADAQANLEEMPQADDDIACIQYVPTTLENEDYAYGGTVPVEFTFDFGTMSLEAPVSAPDLPAGETPRDYTEGNH